MRKFLIVPTLAVALAAAGSAFAADNDSDNSLGATGPRDQWMTIAQITAKYTAEGYEVRQVTEEEGGYELYALKDGKRIEAHVDPVTGEMFGNEIDD